MYEPVLPTPEYYEKLNRYIVEVGLPWSIEDVTDWDGEYELLHPVMGDTAGRAVLDCSCGWGRQTIALAQMGWNVTATDISDSSMDLARQRAQKQGLDIDFRACDMRDLAQHFRAEFDWVISCFALYEILDDDDIQRAVHGMFAALKPGGKCYLRLRNMDFLPEDDPSYRFRGEKSVPHGRIICIDDWILESETHFISVHAFLREDERRQEGFRWHTDILASRVRLLGKTDLIRLLKMAGFQHITFLPKDGPWFPYEIVASKLGN